MRNLYLSIVTNYFLLASEEARLKFSSTHVKKKTVLYNGWFETVQSPVTIHYFWLEIFAHNVTICCNNTGKRGIRNIPITSVCKG